MILRLFDPAYSPCPGLLGGIKPSFISVLRQIQWVSHFGRIFPTENRVKGRDYALYQQLHPKSLQALQLDD
jgi:hypothetical protein